jgi:hypothetical protein
MPAVSKNGFLEYEPNFLRRRCREVAFGLEAELGFDLEWFVVGERGGADCSLELEPKSDLVHFASVFQEEMVG